MELEVLLPEKNVVVLHSQPHYICGEKVDQLVHIAKEDTHKMHAQKVFILFDRYLRYIFFLLTIFEIYICTLLVLKYPTKLGIYN